VRKLKEESTRWKVTERAGSAKRVADIGLRNMEVRESAEDRCGNMAQAIEGMKAETASLEQEVAGLKVSLQRSSKAESSAEEKLT
jgi:hypothetical protein